MGILAIIIKKVAEQASKLVLFGALVGGVSMMSYATEATVGPTIEKAQLEAVHINLDKLVEAITKVDPDWVKGLPKVNQNEAKVAKSATTAFYGVLSYLPPSGQDPARLYITPNTIGEDDGDCGSSDEFPCRVELDPLSGIIKDPTTTPYVEVGSAYTPHGTGPYID